MFWTIKTETVLMNISKYGDLRRGGLKWSQAAFFLYINMGNRTGPRSIFKAAFFCKGLIHQTQPCSLDRKNVKTGFHFCLFGCGPKNHFKHQHLFSPATRKRRQNELRRKRYLRRRGRPTRGIRKEETASAPKKEPSKSRP
jgi:hypothetical protein